MTKVKMECFYRDRMKSIIWWEIRIPKKAHLIKTYKTKMRNKTWLILSYKEEKAKLEDCGPIEIDQ
jgi:hypothetical protein